MVLYMCEDGDRRLDWCNGRVQRAQSDGLASSAAGSPLLPRPLTGQLGHRAGSAQEGSGSTGCGKRYAQVCIAVCVRLLAYCKWLGSYAPL